MLAAWRARIAPKTAYARTAPGEPVRMTQEKM